MRCVLICISIVALSATGCSSWSFSKKRQIYAAGDKATVGPLVYNVIDTEVRQELGDDPNSARTPQERFFLIKVAVSNSSSNDQEIPAMTLVDDQDQSYSELSDGTNVPNWLGLVRKVGPAMTEQGVVVFDAPTKHYRLRLNDPLDDKEVAIDVPLTFAHEEKRIIDAAPAAPSGPIPIPGR